MTIQTPGNLVQVVSCIPLSLCLAMLWMSPNSWVAYRTTHGRKLDRPNHFLVARKILTYLWKKFVFWIINKKFACFPFNHVAAHRELGRLRGSCWIVQPSYGLHFATGWPLIHSTGLVGKMFSCNFFFKKRTTLRWRHNDHAGVSNHQPHGCLLNRLFMRKSKKTSKLRVTGLCVGNSPGTGEFPAQMASNAENVSIWWRHHEINNSNTGVDSLYYEW